MNRISLRPLLLFTLSSFAVGAAAENDLVGLVREDLRAANEARSRQGSEVATWRAESDRLAVAIDGLQTELKRAQQELAVAESQRDLLRIEHQRLGAGDVPAAQKVIAEAAGALRTKLQAAALTLPPGTLVVPADDTIEAAIKAIELSERALSQISVEIAAGHRSGDPVESKTAVRLLRAGSLAWWTVLDGQESGSAAMVDGRLELMPTADEFDRDQIRRAIAMAEGRASGEPVSLPRSVGVAP